MLLFVIGRSRLELEVSPRLVSAVVIENGAGVVEATNIDVEGWSGSKYTSVGSPCLGTYDIYIYA